MKHLNVVLAIDDYFLSHVAKQTGSTCDADLLVLPSLITSLAHPPPSHSRANQVISEVETDVGPTTRALLIINLQPDYYLHMTLQTRTAAFLTSFPILRVNHRFLQRTQRMDAVI